MIPIVIKIGTVTTLSVENWNIIPDDRQTLVETIGGVVVQDLGHVEEGDKISCTVTICPEDASTIYGYWHNRTLVNVIDENGNVHENLRVIIKGYGYISHFKNYYRLTLEFWRV